MTKTFPSSLLKSAAIAAALAFSPVAAQAAECFDRNTEDPKAGNATAVVGPAVDVERQDRADAFRPASGADMFSGDRVRTGDASHMQLKLCDWSTYTFSPNSESAINEFFNAEGAGKRRVVNFFRGGFRMASGRDTEPGSTEVAIQESGVTMGVRGTNVILVELDGFVYALLEGPVRDNSGLTPKGLVEFWNDDNRSIIEATLKRPGFAVRIGPDGVSEPFRADDDLLRRIYEAFVPVVPEDEGSEIEYAGDPLDQSGQGTQEADDTRQLVDNQYDQEDENTENYPEEPSNDGEDPDPPIVIPVGDILPLDVLDDFAGMQASPSGNVFVIAPATVSIDSGNGPVVSNGVAMFQIAIDWTTRTVAPEALASFVKFDFSVDNPANLSQDNPTEPFIPFEVFAALQQALLNSAGIPFMDGEGGLAVFTSQAYTLTVRQGPNDTVTADVAIDAFTQTDQGVTYIVNSMADDVMLIPDEGDLAYFEAPLAPIYTVAELDNLFRGGVTTLVGSERMVFSTLGTPALLNGVAVAQLEVDFTNRTVGGGSSFIAISAAADPAIGGQNTVQYVALDQAVPFGGGLFNLAFYTLASLSSSSDVVKGEALLGNFDGFGGDIAAILADDAGNHLYTEVQLFEDAGIGGISTIAELEAQAVTLGGGDFYFDGRSGFGGFVDLERADGSFASGGAVANFDINFANRTVGGGNSHIAFDITSINLSVIEFLNVVSFDDAVSGAGVFGFGAGDFSGTNIENAMLLIRSGQVIGAGESADVYFNFNDGAGGSGFGNINAMPLTQGASPAIN
jgi:hypothetical protein